MNPVYSLDSHLSLIDLYDLKRWNQTGCYVLHEEKLAIIETSASFSIPYLLAGLKQLAINPKDIEYIIVTHIHLDHSGGAGLLLKECPNAKVVVHPNGKRHLVDPSRLINSAKLVYKEDFNEKFDPIVPIPEDRIIVMEDKEQLTLSEERTLTFYHTRGHANHHFSIYDSRSNGIFTGDSSGIYYGKINDSNKELVLPTTSPNQFDLSEALLSISLMRNLNPSRLYFSHFGMSTNVDVIFDQMEKWLPLFVNVAEEVFLLNTDATSEELSELIVTKLAHEISLELSKEGVSLDKDQIKNDLIVSSLGLIHYLKKKMKGDK